MSILIYDDNEENLRVMEGSLSSVGYETLTSSNIIESIKMVEKNSKEIDLIITKFDLLQFTLRDYLYILRKLNRDIRVVVLSSSNNAKDELESIDLCVDEYIRKPISTAVLQKRIEKVLDLKKDKYLLHIKSDFVVVDTTSHTITKAGEIIELSMKEYQLLVYLIHHSNCIVSRGELYEAIWKRTYDDQKARTIDVHISNLRGKLELTSLYSVRGQGYKLDN